MRNITPARYRTRVTEVTAIQWTGHNKTQLQEFAGLSPAGAAHFIPGPTVGVLWSAKTLCWVDVPPGHYIVRTTRGELTACSPEAMADRYEPA